MKSVLFDNEKIYPSKIVCVGRNYVEHVYELGNDIPSSMVIFMKPNSALSDTLYSMLDEPIHYEGELSFLIKNSKIVAVAFGFDLTKRGLQSGLKNKNLPWERAKAFDGAAVFTSFAPIEESDLKNLSFKLYINNNLTQEGKISLMMYKPQEMLDEIKSFSTLYDGDIIMTGTPKGVGVINSGDNFRGEVFLSDKKIIDSSWIAK